jgi:MYXO-CTERM domain-containing protein
MAALAWTTGDASAHVQVSPAVVAPDDAVKFTVLVPGERDARTTRVALKMPAGLLPFSWADTPGWQRKLVATPDGGVDQVVWTGRLPSDGFAEFSFLAGTPERAGQLVWKALQTYSDGTVVSWIGSAQSNDPAPVTRVVKGSPVQNAGGDSGAPPGAVVASTPAGGPVATATPLAPVVSSDPASPDWVARGLAAAALLALGAISLQRRRRKVAVR